MKEYGDADLDDYAIFAECLAGPEVTTPPGSCMATQFDSSDLTGDGDVDLADFGRLICSVLPEPGGRRASPRKLRATK